MKTRSKRQFIRRAIIFVSFLVFPLTYYFFSPYLIVEGAFAGVISGSAITFACLLISSLLLGRAWCAWGCPGGGLTEVCTYIRDEKVSQKGNWIKWAIWAPWMISIVIGFIAAKELRIDPLYQVSLGGAQSFIIYYLVTSVIVILSLAVGARAFCHYVCWMAPFMIIGRKIRNLINYPSLRLAANAEKCTDCKLCNRHCPMSLDVNALVHQGNMEHHECILCGNCVDSCAQKVITYRF